MRARTVIGWLGMGLAPAGALVVVAAGGLLGGAVDTATAEDRVGKADWHRTEADIKVYKTAACGCCSSWVEHLRRSGFAVEAVDVAQDRLYDMKQAVGLSRDLASCHTAFIDGYVVEGHVPAADIRRLVTEGPDVNGVTVPGMPIGSPGMEYGDRRDAYDVLTFDETGRQQRFATHNR